MPLLISHRAWTAKLVQLLCRGWMAQGSIRDGKNLFSLQKIRPEWSWSLPSLLQFVPGLYPVGQSAGPGYS